MNADGVMDMLTNDPETLQLLSSNPEARQAFIQAYYGEAGAPGGYDGAAPTGQSGGGFAPGAAMDAIAQPVMPQTVNNILQQPPGFFQELALVDGFDARRFGNAMEANIYA